MRKPRADGLLTVRLPREYIAALGAVAQARGESRSHILLEAVDRYLREMYYNRARDVIHLQDLIRHVKEYVSLARMTVSVVGLPAKKRRDELEEVMWKAVQDAVQYAKTEEAATNAEKRLFALMVVARLAQVHNAIHIFYKIMKDKDFEDFSRHHVTWNQALEASGPLKKTILEKIKKQLATDPWRWQREMEAEWSEDESCWLPQALIGQCQDSMHEIRVIDKRRSFWVVNPHTHTLSGTLSNSLRRFHRLAEIQNRSYYVVLLVARGRFEFGLDVSRRQVSSPSSGIQSHLVALLVWRQCYA